MKKLNDHKKPVPFSLKVWEFNQQNKSAGRVKVYENCTLMQKGRFRKYEKDPNHWHHRTRNVKFPNGEIKKIHTLFIKEFNGKKVIF